MHILASQVELLLDLLKEIDCNPFFAARQGSPGSTKILSSLSGRERTDTLTQRLFHSNSMRNVLYHNGAVVSDHNEDQSAHNQDQRSISASKGVERSQPAIVYSQTHYVETSSSNQQLVMTNIYTTGKEEDSGRNLSGFFQHQEYPEKFWNSRNTIEFHREDQLAYER